MRIHVCVAGLKGFVFLRGLLSRNVPIAQVHTYRQDDDRSRAFESIVQLSNSNSIPLAETKRPTLDEVKDADLIFLVGWQFMLPFADERLIVFHDSLLPRYRGFSPTVTALIGGDEVVGVTALRPISQPDAGPILAQAEFRVDRPARIQDVLQRQAELMVELAAKLTAESSRGPLLAEPQQEAQATYSAWRDTDDYYIDWALPAPTIERFVYAVGTPYEGARTILNGEVVIISECASAPEDLEFPIRQPGKVWQVSPSGPVVICGRGLLQISAMQNEQGQEVHLKRLRSRFRNHNPFKD